MSILEMVEGIETRAKSAGLTTKELCRRAGVSRSNFHKWKSGMQSPSYRIILMLEAEIEKANDAKKEPA